MTTGDKSLDQLSVDTIRTLSIDAIQKANSGHPGLPLGAAPMAYVLWQNHLRHDPRDPSWPDRDRFVLSAGHGSMLLYSLLHLTGYDVSLDDIKDFRQWESKTPGHPEAFVTPGVEATTGPLGQGVGNAVGMAIAERSLAATFNRPGHEIVDHRTYALVSDGDLMEGIAAEACSLAGHLGLGKLTFLYDDNDVSLDGPTSLAFSEDVAKRFESYGWHVVRVTDGNTDFAGLDQALIEAKGETDRPSLILVKTTIGFGSPNKAGTASAHGSPLGDDEVRKTKEALGWEKPEETFHLPAASVEHMGAAVEKGGAAHAEWKKRFQSYREAHPDLSTKWDLFLSGGLPDGWDSEVPSWSLGDKVATRASAGKVLNAIAPRVENLIGGDADLSGSTKTFLSCSEAFDGTSGVGRNLHFGVREHAMGAIANGIAYHGGLRAFVATFFCFADYMRPSVRLAALCHLPVTYVWTHDSIGVGEDGPTHQPVEHLASLRVIPNLHVMRPGDGSEAAAAWRYALQRKDGPVALVLSRQGVPELDHSSDAADAVRGVARGAYVLLDAEGSDPDVILIGTGSELQLAVEARDELKSEGVQARVVSMPCWKLFQDQDDDYRDSVLPSKVTARVAVEAGATFGWSQWVGDAGVVVGIDRFGASSPGGENMEKFGMTAKAVVEAAHKSLARTKARV